MRNRYGSQYIDTITEYYQASRSGKHPTNRDRNKYSASKQYIQDADGRCHIQYIGRVMKHHIRRYGNTSILHPSTPS